MKLKDVFYKRISFFFLTLFFIAACVIAATYSLANNDINKVNKEKNQSINVEFLNGDETLRVSEYPISNELGSIYAPTNIIKINNKSQNQVSYQIVINETSSNELKDLSKIYVSFNNEYQTSLDKINNGILKSNIINPNRTDVIDIRIWISKDEVEETDTGKKVGLSLKIMEKI